MDTGVIYGFFRQLLNIRLATQKDRFIFIWDSGQSKRKEYFEGYKSGRHKNETPEEKEARKRGYKQFQIIRKRWLPSIGFNNVFIQTGYEGDDLIAGSDKDLYQLLSRDVRMYKGAKKGFYSVEDFQTEYTIYPENWIRVKAIAGCDSDTVPGIKGVGEKTVCKFIRGELKPSSAAYQKITCDEGLKIEKFNLPLVSLPYPGTEKIELVKDDFKIREFIKMCKYYSFKSILEEDIDEWRKFDENSENRSKD
jgi:DNA polymerase-1